MKKFLLWLGGTAFRLWVVLGPVICVLLTLLIFALLILPEEIINRTVAWLSSKLNRLARYCREIYNEQKAANRKLRTPTKPIMLQARYEFGILLNENRTIIPVLHKRPKNIKTIGVVKGIDNSPKVG